MRRLAETLDRCSTEMRSVARGLGDVAEAATVETIARSLSDQARIVLHKASAVEATDLPRVTVHSRLTPAAATAGALDNLIAESRQRIWEELRRVVGELNRLGALGIRGGPMISGLHNDYNTLAHLTGMNVVYFAIDGSSPIGTRSGRAGYRAAVWIGPLDADHVVFMIPGMNTTTKSWLEHNVPDARRLQETAAELAVSHKLGSVAVVPLLSYEPPQTFLDAPLGRFWKDGSRETAAVLASLPLENRHVTGWGHSYGAAVLGATSAISTPFDDLIMVGAAGTGTESLGELGIGADHLYVATNWNDPIRLVPNDYHGVNPGALPHTALPTRPATDFEAWKAVLSIPWFLLDGLPDHNYLDDPIAIHAFAAVAVGLDDLIDRPIRDEAW